MGERLPEAWMVEWHRNRRVEFPLRRWSFLQFPVLLGLGPSLLLMGRLPDMLDEGAWRYFGYLIIVGYAGIAIAVAWQLITQRPYVVVDRTGVRAGRRFMPWTDVGSIGLIRGQNPFRELPIHPKNVWAKDLVLSRQHVNDLAAFRSWLDELLAEHRQVAQEGGVE
ncbi:hypothetical protein ACQPYH_35915 [Kribbella sp. CA-245084]|uniref:hypothetical protein n=1 Tax=Kribbella sp. CA-245084 TaxID=3239940 RepID=UPI003D8EE42D